MSIEGNDGGEVKRVRPDLGGVEEEEEKGGADDREYRYG